MVRPRRFRRIFQEPQIRCFKPDLSDAAHIKTITITIDEFEAIRLKEYQNIKQQKAAEMMDVSQPTFHRILNLARRKIAKALTKVKSSKLKEAILWQIAKDTNVKAVVLSGTALKKNMKNVLTVNHNIFME